MSEAEAEAVATEGMDNLTIVAAAPKGTAKRDALRSNEVAVQQQWEEMSAFEATPVEGQESFMVTFPYPYSNGHLHIGHAFSLTKAIFRAQYERHLGKNVLFPFAFHCTGMPIQAVRNDWNCNCNVLLSVSSQSVSLWIVYMTLH
jgi:isoleucyl-tRNA synthetase